MGNISKADSINIVQKVENNMRVLRNANSVLSDD